MNTPHTRRLKRMKRRRADKLAGHKLTSPEKKRGNPKWVRFDKQWYPANSRKLLVANIMRDRRQRDKATSA